ncbi:MAG: flagellar basal body rod protein FlgB [Armatimonadetes bacterium]|nr:flagellar basal body rod protein FlgB [Armatimonadota bacterium]
MDNLFFDPTIKILHRSMDAAALSQEVLSNNIANVNTPEFKRSEVSFRDQLQRALAGAPDIQGQRTHPSHIPIGGSPSLDEIKPVIVRESETTLRNDGNNVDIDAEMVKLSQNSLEYGALSQLIRQKITMIRNAIIGR